MKVYSVNCLLGIVVGGKSFSLLSNRYIEKNINMSISLTVQDRAISLKFSNHRVSKKVTIDNFQKIFLSPKMASILNFRIFAKNGKHKFASISLTVICQSLTPAQLKQLSTPTYQSRKERELKKSSSESLLVLPLLSWTQQTLVCWDGYTRNLMEVHLLARRKGQTLPLPPRLAVRRNPAASRDLMI